jgi:hypothetical protein
MLGVANIADVEFRCCRHVMLGFVSRMRRGKLLMLDVARNTVRNMGPLGVVLGGGGRRPHDVGYCMQHAHNIARWTLDLTADG